MTKLAVGIRDVAHLAEVQAERVATNPPLRTLTRNFPRRAREIVDGGGSMYWVVAGSMLVRQRILDVVADTRADGTACAAIWLDPKLVMLAGRPTSVFQGWRYLEPAAAPPDLAATKRARGVAALPEAMRRELQALGLL